MFSTETYTARRAELKRALGNGLALFVGNAEVGMNYAANPYPFRQDSTFLYYFGIDKPDLVAVIDVDNDREILFGDDLTLEDIVWMGQQPRLREQADRVGVRDVLPLQRVSAFLKKARRSGQTLHFLPPYRPEHRLALKGWLNLAPEKQKAAASEAFIRAVVAQRSRKSDEEVAELERAVNTTGDMHVAAMKAARPGQLEAELAGLVEGIAVSAGGHLAYPVILTVQGQILHNHYHGNVLQPGQLVLGDFGAETALHYAGDLTRTFPVSARFTPRQHDIYQIVLDAQLHAIALLKPGVRYLDVHLAAARRIAEGLKALGLMQGDVDEAVAQGAHALFFPHGLGHMMGLDVHDMENLGENYVGYSSTVQRSTQFGTAYLRLARELEPGFVLTVEPGIYFIPQLMQQWKRKKQCAAFINYKVLDKYCTFGGIRIEDNVLITTEGYRILGKPVPKSIAEVEALRAEAY
ncbi:MAG: aminopeptidase P family protein [Saprospiraceae bacterium]|nr:aminopeptidase P family protein [Saprospiraceae bacterium]MDW8231021.1 aminopeptidase P family protein [Saprospiraceae bacterium]